MSAWIAFADRDPPEDARLDDPSVTFHRRVLVTNNFMARNSAGRMSHVWYVMPIQSEDGSWTAFDEADRQIHDLTYWIDPLEGVPFPGEQA
jgi:hypothetical protein